MLKTVIMLSMLAVMTVKNWFFSYRVKVCDKVAMDRLEAPARLMIVSDLDHTMVGVVIPCFLLISFVRLQLLIWLENMLFLAG